MKRIFLFSFAVVSAVLIMLAVLEVFSASRTGTNKATIRLTIPPFVQSAYAQTNPEVLEIGQKLDSEAGISAYFQVTDGISLNLVRSQFRTIETETADYIIGSVPVPNYPETEDVHVYINKNGWVLTYYLNADPVGKIFDWLSYDGISISTTRLRNVLAVIAGASGSPMPDVLYYDFRYPNATTLLLVADAQTTQGVDSFQINLPSSFGYFERSYSIGSNCAATSADAKISLDGSELHWVDCTWSGTAIWRTGEGTLTAAQLLPDTPHTFETNNPYSNSTFGGLAIVYRVP